jgi:hypothetical protein
MGNPSQKNNGKSCDNNEKKLFQTISTNYRRCMEKMLLNMDSDSASHNCTFLRRSQLKRYFDEILYVHTPSVPI